MNRRQAINRTLAAIAVLRPPSPAQDLAPFEQRGGSWDVVIDNSGYVPARLRPSSELLAGSVGHYIFTSTINACKDFHTAGIAEDYPLALLPDGAPHTPGRYYGPLNAICEKEVAEAFPGRPTIIRPGWVAGPGERDNALTYRVMRVRRGGQFAAPGTLGATGAAGGARCGHGQPRPPDDPSLRCPPALNPARGSPIPRSAAGSRRRRTCGCTAPASA